MELSNNTPLGALIKTSLVDYPSNVSSVLFLHGCNLRCPYCYNTELVCGSINNPDYVTFEQVISHLEKRQNVLTGFVLSGGEALLSPYLPFLIKEAKNLGYKIKLDTNGTFPDKLKELLRDKELCPDFVALDIKTSPKRYIEFSKNKDVTLEKKILQSIKIISNLSKEKREFRTVLVPTLITQKEILEISNLLPNDGCWQFAPFRNDNCIDNSYNDLLPYTQGQMDNLVELAKTKIPNSNLR